MGALAIGVLLFIAYMATSTPAPQPDRVVLLPSADGGSSSVIVKSAGGETALDRSYAVAEVNSKGAITAAQSNAAEVQARFAAVLAALPPRPVTWTVYFVSGRDELTPDSRPQLDQVKAELLRRPAPEISVIGHTDRVGKVADNDALSRVRAAAVRDALVGAGIDVRQIEVSGRGEREPLVPTADEVDEPKNRRVEISVR